jgi:hypothetical protein
MSLITLVEVADFLARGGRDTCVIGPLERGEVLIASLSTAASVLDTVTLNDEADRDELAILLRERFRVVRVADNNLQAAKMCAEYAITMH